MIDALGGPVFGTLSFIVFITLPDLRYLLANYVREEGQVDAVSMAQRLVWATGMTFVLLGIVVAVSLAFKIADWVMERR
jgi:cytochrome bd-type quinol oxidase subunit 2